MFSQYNFEQQAWARQSDIRRSARATRDSRNIPANEAQAAPAITRLGLALAAAAPVITLVLWLIVAH
jgi:hypothetical protein